jgi:hypothetical protein
MAPCSAYRDTILSAKVQTYSQTTNESGKKNCLLPDGQNNPQTITKILCRFKNNAYLCGNKPIDNK